MQKWPQIFLWQWAFRRYGRKEQKANPRIGRKPIYIRLDNGPDEYLGGVDLVAGSKNEKISKQLRGTRE